MLSRKDLRPFSQQSTAEKFDPTGLWINELGSTMTIEEYDGTNFFGSYTSLVSADGKTVSGRVSGTIAGDSIAFTVNWKADFSSVTAWSGIVMGSEEGSAIYTLWHLSSTPESDDDVWQSIKAGSDLFVRE